MDYRRRRLEKELKLLKITSHKENSDGQIIQITLVSKYNHQFIFDIPLEYPFKPPLIKRNNVHFKYISFDPELSKKYTKVYGKCPCTCCLFPFYNGNWSPVMTLDRVCDYINAFEEDWFQLSKNHIQDVLPFLSSDIQSLIAEYF